jgi:hypothetical protein
MSRPKHSNHRGHATIVTVDMNKKSSIGSATEVGSSSPVGEGEELFRDSGWLSHLEVTSSCVAEGGIRF